MKPSFSPNFGEKYKQISTYIVGSKMRNIADRWLAEIINLPDLPEEHRLTMGRIRKKANQMVNDGIDPIDVMNIIFNEALAGINKRFRKKNEE